MQPGHREVDRHECAGRRPYPVLEFMCVFKTLDDQEDRTTQDRHAHVQFVPAKIFYLQRGPTHDHRHAGDDQHQRIDRGQRDTQPDFGPIFPSIRAGAQEYVRRE